MDKILDIILGWPGLLAFLTAIVWIFAPDQHGVSHKEQCESKGGRYVQTMKSYHTCKMPEVVAGGQG
jgi:hypothetical protein